MKHSSVGSNSLFLGAALLVLVLPCLLGGVLQEHPSYHFVEAQTYHSTGVRRGAYMSLWSDKIGDLSLESIHGGDLYRILGNATKEQMALDFLKKWNFNAVVFYNLYKIWTAGDLAARLKGFMEQVRTIGITNIEAATSKWYVDYIQLEKWNNQVAENDNQKFDGYVTEIEFWNSGKISEITDAIDYASRQNISARTGKKLYVCAYLGWVKQSQVETLEPLIDYFWPHAYDNRVAAFWGKTKDRIEWLVEKQGRAVTNTSVKVTPIFSTESTQYSACTTCRFAGDVLRERGNFQSIEQDYRSGWALSVSSNPTSAPPIALLTGYQWYEYVFSYLMLWDKHTPTGTTPTNTTVSPASSAGGVVTTTNTPTTTAPSATSPTTEPEPLKCTSSDDCLCPGTWCKDNGFCGGEPCVVNASSSTGGGGGMTTMTPMVGPDDEPEPLQCTVTEDCLCPGTWCKDNGFCGGRPCKIEDAPGGIPYVKGMFRIAGSSFDILLNDTTMKNELKLAVRTDLARILELAIQYVRVDSMEVGSLVVEYSTTDHSRSVEETNTRIRDNQDRGGLRMIQRVYTNRTGISERLQVTEATAEDGTVRGKSLCGEGLSARDCAAVLIGSGVTVLVIAIVGCVCCVFHSRRPTAQDQAKAAEEDDEEEPLDAAGMAAHGRRTASGPAARQKNPVTMFTPHSTTSHTEEDQPQQYREPFFRPEEQEQEQDENDNDPPFTPDSDDDDDHGQKEENDPEEPEGSPERGGEEEEHQYVLDENTGYYKYTDPSTGKRYLYDAESALYYDDPDFAVDHHKEGDDQ